MIDSAENSSCFTIVRQCQLQVSHASVQIIRNLCSSCSLLIRIAQVLLAHGHIHRRIAFQSTKDGVRLLVETKNLVVVNVEVFQCTGKNGHVIGDISALDPLQLSVDLQRLACVRNRFLPRFLFFF